MARKVPPTRKSIVACGQVKLLGPIQRFRCAALDQSANTNDGGASKTRTIRSSLSAIFLGAVIAFSFLELSEVGGHLVEALVPETPIDRQPVIDGPETFWLQLARPPLGLTRARDQAGFLQHLEMARHGGKADRERLGDLVDRRVALREPRQDGPPGRVREGREGGGEGVW